MLLRLINTCNTHFSEPTLQSSLLRKQIHRMHPGILLIRRCLRNPGACLHRSLVSGERVFLIEKNINEVKSFPQSIWNTAEIKA